MKTLMVALVCVALVGCGKLPDKTELYRGSNLWLHTDYATGCEYVSGSHRGALTPRLDASGKHICNKGESK